MDTLVLIELDMKILWGCFGLGVRIDEDTIVLDFCKTTK